MKKTFLILGFIFLAFLSSYSQDYAKYESIKLDSKEDFTKEVNLTALQACNYLLSVPLDSKNESRIYTSRFLMRWMTGTPDFTFNLDETATNISKSNEDLLIVYLASMAKYCLENPGESKNQKTVKLNTVLTVINYCDSQKIKMSGELKKLNKAREKGELEKEL